MKKLLFLMIALLGAAQADGICETLRVKNATKGTRIKVSVRYWGSSSAGNSPDFQDLPNVGDQFDFRPNCAGVMNIKADEIDAWGKVIRVLKIRPFPGRLLGQENGSFEVRGPYPNGSYAIDEV